MSVEENIRRREIRKHATVSAQIAESIVMNKKLNQQRLKEKFSEENKHRALRSSLLQHLDKENKNASENKKYKNMLEFINSTTEMISKDFNSLPVSQQTENNIKTIAKHYATHVKVIKRYAAENYHQSINILDVFIEKIEKINSELVNYFKLETIQLMSL